MTHYGVIGVGPVGSMLAACLTHAGEKVSVYCRNSYRADDLQNQEIIINGALSFQSKLGAIYSDISDFIQAKPEVILIATKTPHSLEILRLLHLANIDPNTYFVSCQNGIDTEDQISSIFGEKHALRLVLNIGANYVGRHQLQVSFMKESYLSQNELYEGRDTALADAWNRGNFTVKLTKEYKKESYKKAILNTSLSTVCALTRMTMRQVMTEPALVRMVRQVILEAITVGKKIGFDYGSDYLETAVTYLSGGGNHKPSMLLDIENHRITENEDHAGKIFRIAEDLGIEVPVVQSIYYLCKGLETSLVLDSYASKVSKGKSS